MGLLGTRIQKKHVFKILEKKNPKQHDPSQAIRRCNGGISIFQNLPTRKK